MNENIWTNFVIVMVTTVLLIVSIGLVQAANPLIPLYTEQPQIMTPYELDGIDTYEQRRMIEAFERQQQMQQMQEYQYQQEQLKLLREIERNLQND